MTAHERQAEGSGFTDAIIAAGLAASDDLKCRLVEDGLWDVRPRDWAILHPLVSEPLTVNSLTRRLGISQQSTSMAVISLEERNYVLRVVDEADLRRRNVVLADRGHAAIELAARWAGDRQHRAVDQWGPGDVRRTTALLRQFAADCDRFSGRGRRPQR